MQIKYAALFLLITLSSACQTSKRDQNKASNNAQILNPIFNICSSWHERMTWADFQEIRTTWQRQELIKYVNKIRANAWLKSMGIPVIPIYFSSEKKGDITAQLSDLSSYVAKPSHMSKNNGLTIVKDGKDIITGQEITPQQVSDRMNALLDTPSNSNEWLLQNMPRGFVIQEYISGSEEIKIQTIWGKVVEVSWFKNGNNYYYYTVDGSPMENAPKFPYMQIWDEAIAIAEKIAVGSDALRVDIMIKLDSNKQSPRLMVNELELRSAMGWPSSRKFATLLNFGYRQLCASH